MNKEITKETLFELCIASVFDTLRFIEVNTE